MGDSGVSCAFTGVSMNYDSVALIALAPKRFLEPRRNPVSYSLGSKSNEPFSAMFLPIFGKLDGYGGLRDIERDRNVLFLEKKLGLRIEDIACVLELGGHIPVVDKLAKRLRRYERGTYSKFLTWNGGLRAMFVLRSAYDLFSSYTMDESGKLDYTMWDSSWVSSHTFEKLGFVRASKEDAIAAREGKVWSESDAERYTSLYRHPQLPRLEVWADERMSARYFVDGKYLDAHIFGLAQLQKALQKLPEPLHFLPEQVSLAQRTPAARIALEDTRRKWLKRVEAQKRNRAYDAANPEITFYCIASDAETQTFCDDQHHYVIDLKTGVSKKVSKRTRCPTGFSHECALRNRVEVSYTVKPPAAFLRTLPEMGWKPRRAPTHPRQGGDSAVVYTMAPEAMLLYGLNLTKLFANEVVGLHHFYSNSKLGNKIWQPSARGCQYGCNRMQSNIARFSQELLQKRLDDEYRRELEDILATSGDE